MTNTIALERTWQFVRRIDAAAGEDEILTALAGICDPLGLSSVFGGLVPHKVIAKRDVRSRILIQKLPKSWACKYNSNGYVFRDPIVERLQVERAPFTWEDAYALSSSSRNVRLIRGEASEFGLHDGFVVPISLPDRDIAAISFGGDAIDLSPDDRSLLGFVASYAIGALLQRRLSTERARGRVSAREYDCLLWAGEGKTDWEISVILGISKSTVTKHILSAREKLGAVTKAHAIAIALREKLLR